MLEPIVSTPQSQRSRGAAARSERALARLHARGRLASCAVIVVLIVLLVTGGGSSHEHHRARPRARANAATRSPPSTTHGTRQPPAHASDRRRRRAVADSRRAVVYVCLIGDNGRKLIPGHRTAGRRSHADLPRQALRDHARQQLGDDVRRRHARTVAALQPGDRLLDHQGQGPPHARGRHAADVQMSAT